MFYLLSRFVSICAGSIYPAYASYKALKANDVPKLETWLMYWVVMGAVWTAESTVEWAVSWFPFYFELKSLVILWLVLPQIQGSTFVYVAHVDPFIERHEAEIDALVADATSKARKAGLSYLHLAVTRIKEIIVGTLIAGADEQAAKIKGHNVPVHPAAANSNSNTNSSPPPYKETNEIPATPGGGLVNLASNYLRQYGPAAVAAGTALLHPMNGRVAASVRSPTKPTTNRNEQMRSLGVAAGAVPSELSSVASTAANVPANRSDARRRRAEVRAELEAELAQLYADEKAQTQQRIFHPRSVSENVRPATKGSATGSLTPLSHTEATIGSRDAASSTRIESSRIGGFGFEEIRREEAREFAESQAAAGKMRSTSTGVGGTSWWKWNAPTSPEKGATASGSTAEAQAKKSD